MAINQALKCPVCGKSGQISCFSMDQQGNAKRDRVVYTPTIALCHNRPGDGRLIWTHHEAPLNVLAALRQQLIEALAHVDGLISDAANDE